ncbi:MAG: hypothetical protein K2W95_05740 [Candidatus Obscuribacterales bacterium]|nr:hypothetical protein [Candidatus Obscuribacterales bacterium]
MFYGFGLPRKDDAVFKVSGDIEQVRLTDYVMRQLFSGAVQSTFRDGVHYYFAEALESFTKKFASFVGWCKKYLILRLVAWVLMPLLIVVAKCSIKVSNNDFNKRRFVKDADGNFTLMTMNPSHEHAARSVLKQLNVKIVSETFPSWVRHFPKPERNGSFTFQFQVAGRPSITLDLQA